MKTVSLEQVLSIAAEIAGRAPAELSTATDLYSDLGLDSLGALELMVALEDAFGIEIGTDEAKTIRTINDVVGLLRRRVMATD
jgi:acyl carrier protein